MCVLSPPLISDDRNRVPRSDGGSEICLGMTNTVCGAKGLDGRGRADGGDCFLFCTIAGSGKETWCCCQLDCHHDICIERVLFSLPESAGVKSDREVSCPYLGQVAPFDRLKVRGETLFSHKVLFSFPFLSATQ